MAYVSGKIKNYHCQLEGAPGTVDVATNRSSCRHTEKVCI